MNESAGRRLIPLMFCTIVAVVINLLFSYYFTPHSRIDCVQVTDTKITIRTNLTRHQWVFTSAIRTKDLALRPTSYLFKRNVHETELKNIYTLKDY